jgi:hypothetical protein
MDWQGIGVVITALGVIVTAFLQFYQYGKNKEIDYKIAKREKDDRAARENEAKKNKAERDAIKAASQVIYRELNRIFVHTNALRAYIVQPHPLDRAKFISVQYEVLGEGMTSIVEQVHRLPIGNVTGFVDELQSRDFIIWHSQAEVRDGRARAMMHNFGIDQMVAKRMMEGEVWLGNIVLDFDQNHVIDPIWIKTKLSEATDIIKYKLPEIEE